MADNTEKNTSKILENIKASASTQAAFNDIVENSVSNLDKVLKKYTEINKSGQGILDISVNLVKSLYEQSKQQKILNNLEKSLSANQKARSQEVFDAVNKKSQLEKKYYEAIKEGDENKRKQSLRDIKSNEDLINLKSSLLFADERIYLLQLQANKVSEDSINKVTNKYNILKGVYNTIKSTTSGLVTGASYFAKSLSSGGANLFSDITSLAGKIPIFGPAISGILGGLKSMLDFILDIEDRTVKFGRNLGYSREESFKIASTFDNLTISSGNLLVTTQNLLEVQTDLSNQLGVTNILSNEMLTTQIELKKIMGLSADEMGSLAQASIISGKNQKETVQGIVGQVAGLKQATGIAFNYKQIIGEVTKLSGVLGLRFAKYPQALTKSAIVAKALGMDLSLIHI